MWKASDQWSFLVPFIGGRYHIIPQLVYTTYIPLIVLAYWVIIYHRSHLLREPETAIDLKPNSVGCCENVIPYIFI